MYVVTVDFNIHAEHFEKFQHEMVQNAASSLAVEPGCLQFDVTVSLADPQHVFLYEVYADEPAFQAHMASDHFKQFNDKTAAWVKDKRVGSFVRVALPSSV